MVVRTIYAKARIENRVIGIVRVKDVREDEPRSDTWEDVGGDANARAEYLLKVIASNPTRHYYVPGFRHGPKASDHFCAVWLEPSVDRRRYPHTCRCGSPAFMGFNLVDCTRPGCHGVLKM